VRDLERTIGRLSSGSGNARDLMALRTAMEQIPAVRGILQNVGQASSLSQNFSEDFSILEEKKNMETGRMPVLLRDLESQLAEMPDLVELIARAIVDEPPLAIKEGGIIRDRFSTDSMNCARPSAAARIGLRNCRRMKLRGQARVAQSAVQFGLRLLHRSHESESR